MTTRRAPQLPARPSIGLLHLRPRCVPNDKADHSTAHLRRGLFDQASTGVVEKFVRVVRFAGVRIFPLNARRARWNVTELRALDAAVVGRADEGTTVVEVL